MRRVFSQPAVEEKPAPAEEAAHKPTRSELARIQWYKSLEGDKKAASGMQPAKTRSQRREEYRRRSKARSSSNSGNKQAE